jgi:hypothetical protein
LAPTQRANLVLSERRIERKRYDGAEERVRLARCEQFRFLFFRLRDGPNLCRRYCRAPPRLCPAGTAITPVRGSGIASRPKDSQIPPDLPPYYPNNLKPQTHLIIAEAVRKFPDQTHTLELCRYVISDLTPHFRTAVQGKTLRADLVFPNMGELLHYILVSNCHREDERPTARDWAKLKWLRIHRVNGGSA